MRFYLLRLTPPIITQTKGVEVTIGAASSSATETVAQTPPGAKEWTSYPNGIYDPAAHNIIFDIPVTAYATPTGAFTVTIEGPALKDLVQAANYSPTGPTKKSPNQAFANWSLELYGGMSAEGLPLSTPAAGQPIPGMIVAGQVLEAFGNWVGTDMSLSFLGTAGKIPGTHPGLVFNWQSGQTISQALATMFTTSYAGMPQIMQVSPNLVGPLHGLACKANTLAAMAHEIKVLTQGTQNGMTVGYPGVDIFIQNGKIICTDGTQTAGMTAIEISLDSLIGQPVWIGNDTLALNVQQRADIQVGSTIKLPTSKSYGGLPGFVTTAAIPGNYAFDLNSAFNGTFIVTSLRQIGEFRGTSGMDWMTVIEAVANQVAP